MAQTCNAAPIGVFDSGLGGLTVLRAIAEQLPHEDLVYLGDSARVPYGTRSAQTVVNYARACARKLREQNIKLLVVACNTVSAVALDQLRAEVEFPVLGVIVPGAHAGVRASRLGRVGVLATPGTVLSGAYPRAAMDLDSRAQVFAEAAPLLVPLVEEGWLEGEVPRLAVRKYLGALVQHGIDALVPPPRRSDLTIAQGFGFVGPARARRNTRCISRTRAGPTEPKTKRAAGHYASGAALVLGCTHYPLLEPVIARELSAMNGGPLPVVDSAHAVASELAVLLKQQQLAASDAAAGSLRILVTDMPNKFRDVASRFLGRDVASLDVTAIDL